jgi:epoxyqueuosine reductase
MSASVKSSLQAAASRLGFAECRIARAEPAAHRHLYEAWVTAGSQGDMAWMAKNVEKRGDPRLVLPGAQSVIVLATSYHQPGPQPGPADYRIARYAWNDDYHDVIKPRLMELDALLIEHGGSQRCYVDTGPVLERDFANESGLGWNGKSTMQIHRQLGTWFFLSTILSTLALEPDEAHTPHCGSCTRCITACPTGAITAPHRMEARRCISYLTIEHRGSIPEELRPLMGDRIYGCDDCLTACPWNRFAQASREAAFLARESLFQHRLRDFLSLTQEEFSTLFRHSPIKRTKRRGFLRNVCVALGNTGSSEDLPALQVAAADLEPLIAEHAAWAISQIRARQDSH